MRHPQTQWNKNRILQGHLDSPLTDFGIETANKLADNLKNKNITKIISSDLGRCIQTTEIVLKKLDINNIKFDKNLREKDLGKYNGCYWDDLPKDLDIHDYDFVVTNGESLKIMKERNINFIENINKNYKLKEDDILLLVTHCGAVTSLLSYAQKNNFENDSNRMAQNMICEFNLKNNKLNLINKYEV